MFQCEWSGAVRANFTDHPECRTVVPAIIAYRSELDVALHQYLIALTLYTLHQLWWLEVYFCLTCTQRINTYRSVFVFGLKNKASNLWECHMTLLKMTKFLTKFLYYWKILVFNFKRRQIQIQKPFCNKLYDYLE